MRAWIFERRLFVEYDDGEVGCELDDTPALFDRVPGARKHTIRADSSRPETISHVARRGFRIESVEKWPDSIKDGIAFLRSFEKIVIHPRCREMASEARLYRYKTNAAGDPLPVPQDKNNHRWDALRYALAPLIRGREDIFAFFKKG